MRGNESARDIDALLLAAGERRRRQVPQSLGQIELAQQLAGPDKRLSPLDASLHQRFSNDIVCADARHDAQELTNVTDGIAPDFENGARRSRGKVDHLAVVLHQDLSRRRSIVAVQYLEDGALADPRRPVQHCTLACRKRERRVLDHRQRNAAAQMHGEGFTEI